MKGDGELRTEAGETHILAIYLHADEILLDFALKTTAQVAICVLQIAYLIYPARMELQGIRHDLDQITTRYRAQSEGVFGISLGWRPLLTGYATSCHMG